MKKKLSLLMVALVAIAAFAATVAKRAPGDTIKTVDGTTTTWDLTAITAEMGSTLSTLWKQNGNYYQTIGQTAEMPDFAPGLTFIDTNSSGGKCRIYVAGENPGQGFYFGGNAAAIDVPVSAGQTLIVTTTGGGGVKSLNDKVSFTITGTGPYVSTAIIPDDVNYVRFARNAGSATYCTTIVTKTETKAPANLQITSEAAVVLPVGATSEISYTTDSKADVTFESSAPDVATVSNAGVIEAVASGASVITVSQAETDDYQAGVAQVSVAVPYAHTAAAEYTIGNDTYGFSDANNNYYFTNGFTMLNSGNKPYGYGSLEGSMKYSANTTYTINIPEGVTITSATVTGRSNYTSGNTAYWGNLFGEDLATEALPSSDEEPATKIIKFAEGATGTLTFTPAGNQVQFIITLAADGGDVPAAEPVEFTFNTDAGIAELGIAKPEAGAGTNLKDLTPANQLNRGIVTITTTDGGTPTRVWNSNGTLDLRIYKGATLTFVATDNNITKIELDGAAVNAFSVTDGKFSAGTWTGDASSVTLTATGTGKINTITVTYGEAPAVTVATPTFSPEAGTYNEDQTVTISCATEGADIYYALGEGEFQKYTEPLTITETTTVKAYAQKGEDKSATATATYTINKPKTTIAELTALNNNDPFTFSGAAVVVAKPTKNHIYVKDESGSSLIYDASGTKTEAAEVGKTIAAPWTGTVSIYKNLFELVPDAALVMKDGEAVAVTYPTVTDADIIAENVNQVVTLKGVTYTALDGKKFNIKSGDAILAGFNQFGIEIAAPVEDETYDIVGAIGRYSDDIQFQPISITRVPKVLPVTVEATDITGGDITAALAAKTTAITEAGDKVGNITINLAENGAYTVSAPIVSANNLIINGAAGATIDASGNAGDFITLQGSTVFAKKSDDTDSDHYLIAAVSVSDVKISGLKGALITDAQKTLLETLTISNAVVEMPAAGKNVINFNGKGYVGKVVVKNSTIWANGMNTGFFAQYGSRPKNVNGDWLQEFDVQNSTLVNIANGKNVCDLKQNGTAQNVYTLKNNIFVDCGKSAQVVVGFNKGQASATPVWDVTGNIFNWGGVDVSAAEVEKAGKHKVGEGEAAVEEDIVKNSVAGVMAFTNAAEGDFSGTFQLAQDVAVPTVALGDPRWTITYKECPIKTIWRSEEAVALSWGTVVNVEKANTDIIEVGDIIHIAVQGVTAGEAWSAQAAIFDQQRTQLENGCPVGTGDVADAAFIVTGDMLALIKANGLMIAGDGYSTKQVTVERGVYSGSENSIWVGDAALTWTQASVTKFHFINSNVTAGQIIKLTYEATGNPNIQLRYGWGETDVYGQPTYGEGFATLEVSAEAVEILKDKGLIINADGIRLTQMELLPAPPVDIVISPEEGADIYTALKAETDKVAKVGNISVYLAPGKKFTISQSIVAPAAFVIMGAAPGTDPSSIDETATMAEIDASALTGPLVQMSAEPAVDADANGFYPLGDVGFLNVKVTGLTQQLFYANKVKYLFNCFHLDFCNINIAGGSKTVIDTNGGGVIATLDMSKNTIWANPENTGALYSSQSGQKATEAGLTVQTFNIERNTIYNIAYGKNFCSHRQSNQTWLTYNVRNNVFVNCGKSGQVIKGLNGGSSGANPTWNIDGNVFNFDGADTSANESTGDADEPVKNSLAGIFAFTDAANGDFNGVFKGKTAEAPAKYPGDPRWTYTYEIAPTDIVISPESGADIAAALSAAKEGILKVGNITINLTAGAAYTLSETISAPNNLIIKGEDTNPAIVTMAESMTDNVITLAGTEKYAKKADGTDSDHKLISSVEVTGVKLLGLQAALIKDTQKTLLENLTIKQSIIEMPAAGKNVIDFNSQGYVGKVAVTFSTIYAKDKNTGFFAQYGSRPKNVNGDWLQEFDVQNSTIVNIANGKNICDLKQNGTAQNVYTLKNNIFVDCGKNGQVVVGFNKGQGSATPVWDVDKNLFNFGGVDTSATEVEKAGKAGEEDIVKNSVAGIIKFQDAANGDFNGSIVLAPETEAPATMPGDPRWTLTTTASYAIAKTAAENGSFVVKIDDAEVTAAAAEATVAIIATPSENYEVDAVTVKDADDADVTVEKILGQDNAYQFTMPAKAVTVTVTFKNATGINSITADKMKNATIYNMKGQRVDKAQKGLYIINGKKVVIK